MDANTPKRNLSRVCLTTLALLMIQLVPAGLMIAENADAAAAAPSNQFGKSGPRQWGYYNMRELVGSALVPVIGREVTLGVNWVDENGNGKDAMIQAMDRTMCLTWDDSVLPPSIPPMTTTDCTAPTAQPNVDPIMYTDFDGGRTFAGGLQIAGTMSDPTGTAAVLDPYCDRWLPSVTAGPPPPIPPTVPPVPPSPWPYGLTLWPQSCTEGCSTLAFTDTYNGQEPITGLPDWLPAGPACSLPGWDHETVSVGPWAYPPPAGATYDRAVYYCSQGGFGATAACWVSLDGGLTFIPQSEVSYGGSSVLMPGGVSWACGGLHGHMRITRAYEIEDQATNLGPHPGHIYLPFKSCGGGMTSPGQTGVAWSTDNAISWNLMMAPVSDAGYPNRNDCSVDVPIALQGGFWDPSVAPSLDHGWLYVGQTELDDGDPALPAPYTPIPGDHAGAYIAMTKDNGVTWEDMGVGNGACPGTKYLNVGALASPPVKQAAFAEVIAGDDDRAAFAFLGTPDGSSTSFAQPAGACGTNYKWYLYIAITYDAGHTWEVDRLPDLVNVGGLNAGQEPSANCRHLLDFNDIVTDKFGRVLVGFTDGCTGTCAGLGGAPDVCPGYASHSCTGAVARQFTGRGLLSKYDIPDPEPQPIDTTTSGENAGGPPGLAPPPEGATDTANSDTDNHYDSRDNCVYVPNEDQKDTDFDRKGDACDPDDDNDGFIDGTDNCPTVANPQQGDRNGNGFGDLCDDDADSDGKQNFEDNCWLEKNADQANMDGDSDGDVCDLDIDGDGMPNAKDCMPTDKGRWSCVDTQVVSAQAAEKAIEVSRAKSPAAGNSSAVLMVGGVIVLLGIVALMLLLMRRK